MQRTRWTDHRSCCTTSCANGEQTDYNDTNVEKIYAVYYTYVRLVVDALTIGISPFLIASTWALPKFWAIGTTIHDQIGCLPRVAPWSELPQVHDGRCSSSPRSQRRQRGSDQAAAKRQMMVILPITKQATGYTTHVTDANRYRARASYRSLRQSRGTCTCRTLLQHA